MRGLRQAESISEFALNLSHKTASLTIPTTRLRVIVLEDALIDEQTLIGVSSLESDIKAVISVRGLQVRLSTLRLSKELGEFTHHLPVRTNHKARI